MVKLREKELWKCGKVGCGKTVHNRTQRWRHEKSCKQADPIIDHEEIPTPLVAENGSLTCSACKYVYTTMQAFSRHKKVTCPNRVRKRKGIQTTKIKDPRPHKCKDCGSAFKTPSKLARHWNSMHKVDPQSNPNRGGPAFKETLYSDHALQDQYFDRLREMLQTQTSEPDIVEALPKPPTQCQ